MHRLNLHKARAFLTVSLVSSRLVCVQNQTEQKIGKTKEKRATKIMCTQLCIHQTQEFEVWRRGQGITPLAFFRECEPKILWSKGTTVKEHSVSQKEAC